MSGEASASDASKHCTYVYLTARDAVLNMYLEVVYFPRGYAPRPLGPHTVHSRKQYQLISEGSYS